MFYRAIIIGLSVTLSSALLPQRAAAEDLTVNWPSFRGPAANGVGYGCKTPTTWNIEEGKNVKWKTPIPGLAHSSPIVWGDRIFVTSAVSEMENPELKVGLYGAGESADDDAIHKWVVYCLDKNTGSILWERVAHSGKPKVLRHTKATQANCTPATDGTHLVALFGAEGLFCYDLDGNLIWKKDIGPLDAGPLEVDSMQWGYASSPVIHDGRIVIQADVRKEPFVAAFDITSGSELWRTPRKDVCTWSTPTVHASPDRTQVICNGFKHIGGYDLATGKKLWKLRGGGDVPVPTPIVDGDLIYITKAHGMSAPLYAIRTNATGVIKLTPGHKSEKYVGWFTLNNGAYMQTPVIFGDYLYSCRDSGVLKCYNKTTGELLYKERLGEGRSGHTASPVAADGKVYFASEDGDVYVVKAGPDFEILAVNTLGEICMASPAISENTIFFRTRNHLVAITEKDSHPSESVD